MIRAIELSILEGLRWYYGSPAMFAVPALLLFLALFAIQWFRRNEVVLPGLIALILFVSEIFHLFSSASAISFFDTILAWYNTPGPWVDPFPSALNWLLEPIFSFFVAPFEHRFLHEEFLFVLFALYFSLVARTSWKEYQTTRVIFGDLSFSAFLPNSIAEQEMLRPVRSESNELGSGDLATTEEIARWTKPSGEPGDTALAVTNLRGSGPNVAFKSANLVIPRDERNRHVLAIAKTGSGKTTKLILPVLYNDCLCPDRSTIVVDSKPEMWRKLATMTRRYNPHKRILLFNPLDEIRSLSWNILSKIESETDCKLIANTIIMATDNPTAKSDSPFFRNNALAVLNAIMVGLLHAQREGKDTLSMPRIHHIIQSGIKPLCEWLKSNPEAYRTSRTFVELVSSGSQNADTIMSELSMRISAWDLPQIRRTTALNELDIETLITHPTLFIVEFRESELEMLRPLANVIVIELLRFLTKRAESYPGSRLPRPVGLVIDEFASALGRLPDIHVKLNTLRSRNVSIVAAIQSIAQVKANYGDDADSVLAGFSTKILMPALDIQDAEWASKESGQMTIRFSTASTGSNKKIIEWFASQNLSTQEQVQQRAVLTPDEIGRPADNRITFFMPNTAPFQGDITPFYKQPLLLKRITEFDNQDDELKLRKEPIEYADPVLEPEKPAAAAGGGGGGTTANGLPPGISDTRTWDDDKVNKTLDETKKKLDWDNTTGSARKWWEAFENENKHRMKLVLRLAEELSNRNATITEFFLAYVYSNTDNIQANLHYLDYTRLKKEEEKKKREAQKNAGGGGGAPSGAPSSSHAA